MCDGLETDHKTDGVREIDYTYVYTPLLICPLRDDWEKMETMNMSGNYKRKQ